MAKIFLRLRVAYMEQPVAVKRNGIFRHCEIDDLDITDELKGEISTWDEAYQNTFDTNDPLSSGFPSNKESNNHKNCGVELAERLQSELGEEYFVEHE